MNQGEQAVQTVVRMAIEMQLISQDIMDNDDHLDVDDIFHNVNLLVRDVVVEQTFATIQQKRKEWAIKCMEEGRNMLAPKGGK